MKSFQLVLVLFLNTGLFHAQDTLPQVQQWQVYEITFNSIAEYQNPYTDVDVWAVFANEHGDSLTRPAFWDGGNTWKVRFTPPDFNSIWIWKSYTSNPKDSGLNGKSGRLKSVPNRIENPLLKNGLLKMSPGHRNVVHWSGKPFLMVGDTPWAIPFRATIEQVEVYAKDRQEKGFNTALMMTVQPDMKAKGPDERNTEKGFKRAFADLPNGHINKINVSYFKYYDEIVNVLLNHEIVTCLPTRFSWLWMERFRSLGKNH